MNVLSDRLVNLFGALAVGITDRIKKAAFDPTIPGGGETTAAIVVIGHATGRKRCFQATAVQGMSSPTAFAG